MGIQTAIEWCDSTVNPTENCQGCELWNTKTNVRKCYAGKMTERWGGVGAFDEPIVLKPGRMEATLKWSDLTGQDRPNKPWLNGMPRVVFVGDMADLFSKNVPFQYIKDEVQDVATRSPHIYMMLTKQAQRLHEFVAWNMTSDWPHNLWVGVSVTSSSTLTRLKFLYDAYVLITIRNLKAPKFFISYEPVLGNIDMNQLFRSSEKSFIDMLIVGGESGTGSKLLDVEIVRNIMMLRRTGIRIFVKQMGTAWARAAGSITYKGGDMKEWPEDIRIREMPL